MIVGIPKEIKNNENRVAITPAGVEALKLAGHDVFIETSAGLGSGFTDEDYKAAGAIMLDSAVRRMGQSRDGHESKRTDPVRIRLFQRRSDPVHLLAPRSGTGTDQSLVEKNVTAIAYETIQLPDRSLPLLTPMSEVAGRMAVQIGAQFLEKPWGGKASCSAAFRAYCRLKLSSSAAVS